MGCCISRSTGLDSPYSRGATTASARHINPPLSLPDGVQTASHETPYTRRREQAPLDEHINKPLRQHKWTSTERQWTRLDLDRERSEFFDTRVTGRPEVWQTIRAAVDVMQEGGPQVVGDEDCNALAMAQSMLSAAEISLPTGDLANGVYDPFGNYYQLPRWVVSDPTNLVACGDCDQFADSSIHGDDDTIEEVGDGSTDGDPTRHTHEKGKGVLADNDRTTLRARLSETGQDLDILLSMSENVRSIARRVASEAALPSDKRVRIAYMGRILMENQSLVVQGWQRGHVVNALVFDRR